MSSSLAAAAAPPGDLMAVACVNPLCREPRSDAPARRRGWRFRSGEPALLCDQCFSAYEQGKFCEIFHLEDSGWCSCETCGKKLHSGCIVSSSAYIFLDAGGIECVPCARKSLAMAPSQIWPTAAHQLAQVSERPNDLLVRNLNTMPTYSRQVQRLWKLASTQSDLNRRLAYELDRPSGPDKLAPSIRTSIFRQEKKVEDMSERIASSSLNTIMRNRYANGSTNGDSVSKQNTFSRGGGGGGMRGSSQRVGEIDPASIRKGEGSIQGSTSSSGVNFDAYVNPSANVSLPSSVVKDDQSSPLICLAAPFPVARDANDPSRVSFNQPHGQTTSVAGKLCTDPPNVVDSDVQAHVRNGKPKIDSRALNHLLPRYRPRITDQELQHMFGDSNSAITPLFEKILSASDAGRIGRLVLPKKCAEAYFPTISQPEGVPLKVQDVKGNEWVFQFRFWPNNNSRMYVLEGVTPCIQSMQLQAGDIVTFSRTNPDGKLVMGFRKASSVSLEQENQVMNAESSVSHLEENSRSNTPIMASLAPQSIKGRADSWSPIQSEDQSLCPKIDQAGHTQKDGPNKKPSPAPTKRKGNTLGPKSKRLRIENKDSIELKLTWQEAQELFRPPPTHPSSIVVIEGHEVEEYEEPPVLGMPTIFTTNQAGETNQWAQCEGCSKWRRLPEDALITFKWTCSDNKWDPKRSSCAAPQELSKAQLADFLPVNTGSSKKSKSKVETEPVEVSDGLDTLANLAILGEGESLPASSQCTTRHPRHRPGCTCIVCIQPPSGKGPKHKPTCICNVCLTVRRRFQTLMMRRELRQSEKEADSARRQHQLIQSPSRNLPQSGIEPTMSGSNNVAVSIKEPLVNYDGMVDDESERRTPSSPSVSPLKNHIDLNIQPEREEEPPHTGNDAAIIKHDSLPEVKAEEDTLD